MSGPNEAFWERVMALVADLDALDYYALLGVDRAAPTAAIKTAYYRRAPGTHPDRHTYERDPERRRALTRLYARFGEAFRVLRDDKLRAAYDQALARGQTRLTHGAQTVTRSAVSGPDPKTPHARDMYEKGRAMLAAGNVKGALNQLRLAAKFEADSVAIAQAIAEAEAAAAG